MLHLINFLSWSRMLKAAFFGFFASAIILNWILHLRVRDGQIFLVILIVLALRAGIEVPLGWHRAVHLLGSGAGFSKALWAFFPPGPSGAIRFTGGLFVGFYNWLKRRPLPSPTLPGERISHMEKSGYEIVLAIALLALFVELPVMSLIIGSVEKDPARLHFIHGAMLFISILTLLLILGDRWQLLSSHHVLGLEKLHLRLGNRVFADLPLARICQIGKLQESRNDWLRRTGTKPSDVMQISPFASLIPPNLLIHLQAGPPLEIEQFKQARQAPAYLMVYVDQPDRLVQKVQQRVVPGVQASKNA